MKKLSLLVHLLLSFTVLGPALAENPRAFVSGETHVTLLELYTSEGCSSCPPADRWMSQLVDDQRLWEEFVPVAFHVDYWDYIGWVDRFARAEFGTRQRAYAEVAALRSVYTPGLVLGGQEWRRWFIDPTLTLPAPGPVGDLRISIDGGQNDAISASYAPLAMPSGPLHLHVARLGFAITTEVGAGENRGRDLHHDFVVLGYDTLRMQPADRVYRAVGQLPRGLETAPRQALAAWVSSASDPRPLQAVGGWIE